MTDHPDWEQLSAHLDGEEDHRAHVEGCAECTARLVTIRAVGAAVAQPPSPPGDGVRVRHVATALAALDAPSQEPEPAGSVAPLSKRSRFSARLVALSAGSAAALLLAVVTGAALLGHEGGDSRTEVSQGPLQFRTGGSAAPSAPGSTPPDLGEIPDAATLRGRVAATATMATPDAAASAELDSVEPTAGESRAAGTDSGPEMATPGTRPCEFEARARRPALGPVTLYATASHHGQPAVVLRFAPPPPGTALAPHPVTLMLMTQAGCDLVLETVAP